MRSIVIAEETSSSGAVSVVTAPFSLALHPGRTAKRDARAPVHELLVAAVELRQLVRRLLLALHGLWRRCVIGAAAHEEARKDGDKRRTKPH